MPYRVDRDRAQRTDRLHPPVDESSGASGLGPAVVRLQPVRLAAPGGGRASTGGRGRATTSPRTRSTPPGTGSPVLFPFPNRIQGQPEITHSRGSRTRSRPATKVRWRSTGSPISAAWDRGRARAPRRDGKPFHHRPLPTCPSTPRRVAPALAGRRHPDHPLRPGSGSQADDGRSGSRTRPTATSPTASGFTRISGSRSRLGRPGARGG